MEYTKLKQEQSEIRIVTILPLQPGTDASVIHCELRHVSLMRPPTYTALSYCWGDPKITREIIVNDQGFLITTNLYLALRRLRGSKFNAFWIDAICINQRDLVEKSMQLLLMGSIYRKAETTIAWLGDHPSEENDLLHENTISFEERPKYLSHMPRSAYVSGMPSSALKNSYWHRVWIIQELALSDEVLFLWPKGSTALSTLELQIRRERQDRLEGVDIAHIDQIRRVLRFRSNMISERPLTFLDALATSHTSFATEPRDKAFALLNLSFNGDRYIPIPNYSQTVQDLSLDITITTLKTTQSLDLLVLFANQEDSSWPSWQPKWLSLSDAGGSVPRKMEYALRKMIWPKDLDFQTCDEFKEKDFSRAWRTSDTFSFPVIKDTCLHVKGFFIPKSHLSSLSTDIEGRPGSILQSPEPQIPPSYKEFFQNKILFKRLFFTLCILGAVDSGRGGTFDVVSYSDAAVLQDFWPGPTNENKQDYPKLFAWFDANQNLPLWGHTLGYWVQCQASGRLAKMWRYLVDLIDEQNTQLFRLDAQEMPDYLYASLKWGMRFAVTEDGHIGWVDSRAQAGHQIAILDGCTVPVVLQSRKEGGWKIVGWCFIHGYMDHIWSKELESCGVLDIY